ncbi:ribbon-helix-helix domain-containing protein [Microvirga sp. W0021]|uniref:Ribbon-helix-helix domain-containing protein n=1 Tax=Hohaiivirga grylli TaxID=3133970 RepID=A0ABV0BP72_9HYPH
MKGAHIVKHSISIAGHQTSFSLEEIFWNALKSISEERNISVRALISQIDSSRGEQNLSSAIRVYVLENLKQKLETAQQSEK